MITKVNILKSGFTLVELAIAMVIIGLITAGILGGQSLIESAKIGSVMSDIGKYRTSINAFKLEYDGLPGDITDATEYWGEIPSMTAATCRTDAGTGTQTCDGDGDKGFDYVFSGNDSRHEPWRAWQHLSNAEILPGNYTGISSTDCSLANFCTDPGVNAPESAIDNASWHLFYFDTTNTNRGKFEPRNLIVLGNPSNLTGDGHSGRWYGMALTPKQQRKIDQKLDDGVANSGKITNMNRPDNNTVSTLNPDCVTLASEIMTYDLSETSIACNLLVDLD